MAVRLHEEERAARHDGRSTSRRSRRWAGRWPRTNGYTAEQSSDLYITDGDQIDWLYAKYRIFTYTFELFPTEKPTVWADHYPDDSKIAKQTARNRQAILLLIDRAACPYATLGTSARQADCGPLYDDLEINRGWSRDPKDKDTASSGLWAVANPAATSLAWPEAAGRRGVRVARAGHRGRGGPEGRVERRRRRRHLDPQPPDHAPGRSRDFGRLTFSYVFAHSATSTTADSFRVLVEAEDGTRTPVFERFGAPTNLNASWRSGSVVAGRLRGPDDPSRHRGEGRGNGNLLEAEVDNIRIQR